ncbi:MAG: polysaccharide biosynthesis C-terminal domain-containing protein [Thermoplasmata archaeon]|nr:polysaccharide biosynthesis C-terminal domain-containing protein [Thermoplasmata archaeon]
MSESPRSSDDPRRQRRIQDPKVDLLTESFRAVGRGTSIAFTGTVLLFLLNLVGRVSVARFLSVPVWGEFSLGVSFSSLLSVVILLGLNQAVARSISYEKDTGERRAIALWALRVTGLVSVAAAVITFFSAPYLAVLFHNTALTGVFELLSLSVGFGAITPIFAAVFQGFHDVFPNALFNQVINPSLFVVFVLLFFLFDLHLLGALLAYVLADAFAFVGIASYYLRKAPKLLPSSAPTPPRPNPFLWTLAIAYWGVASFAFVTGYADTLILGAFRPVLQVGYYSTAMTMARVILMAGDAMAFIYLPVTARLAREGATGTIRTIHAVATRWTLPLTIPLFLLFVILPKFSIDEVFGGKYASAAGPLQILAFTAFFSALLGPVNACLAGLARTKTLVRTSTVSAIVNVSLSFGLIPTFGVFGAAAAWGVSRALYPALGLVSLYRTDRISPFRPILLVPLGVTLALTVPVFLLVLLISPPHWVVVPLFFFGAGVFLLAVLLTRSVAPADLMAVGTLERIVSRPFFESVRRFLSRFVKVEP